MSNIPKVFNKSDHLSDFALDCLVARRLADLELRPLDRKHLDSCALCATRYRAFAGAAENFRQEAARRGLPVRCEQVSSTAGAWRRWLVLGAAACLSVMLWGVRHGQRDQTIGMRSKGSLGLEVWVARRTGQIEFLLSGGHVGPGDRIRFGISTPAAGYLAVASIDGSHNVSLYYPAASARLPAVAPGDHLLPGAIELDEVPGPERLIALRCARSFSREELLAAIRAGVSETAGDSTALDLSGPPRQCAQTNFWLTKEGLR